MRSNTRLLSACLLLVAGFCLFQALRGTLPPFVATASATSDRAPATASSPQLVTRAIQDIRPGMRVLAENPELAGQAIGESDIRPENWRLVSLRMEKPSGGHIDIQLLRPAVWVVLQQLEALSQADQAELKQSDQTLAEWFIGQTIELQLPELGASGPAKVLAVDSCPTIETTTDPHRRVVTGTFHHSAGNLIDLSVEGDSKSLGVTDNHPFWSADREAFVPAGELEVGERLQRADGTTVRIATITPRRGPPTPVYNLEVDAQHVYFVGAGGLLAHNTYFNTATNPDGSLAPIHHIATRFDNIKRAAREGWPQNWALQSQEILENASIGINGALNKVRLPGHFGPHPQLYHEKVFRRLEDAVDGLTEGSEAYSSAVQQELQQIAEDLYYGVGSLDGTGL